MLLRRDVEIGFAPPNFWNCSFEETFHRAGSLKEAAMADIPQALPLPCPHCQVTRAEIAVRSRTVITLVCAACGHWWSLSMDWLPDYVLRTLGRAASG